MTGSDDLSRLFAAERAVAPPEGSADAGLERLLTSLAAHAAPLPVAVGSLKLGWSLVGKWVGAGFAVGLTAAGAATIVSSGPSEQRPHAAPAVSAPAPVFTAANAPEEATPTPIPLVSAPPPRVSPSLASPRAVASADPAPSTFDDELKLIASAKRELDGVRPHLARVWLDDHARRFPRGVFALEREGLLVMARCTEAPNPALARDFTARYPQSPLREQLARRCGEQASPSPPPTVVDFPKTDK